MSEPSAPERIWVINYGHETPLMATVTPEEYDARFLQEYIRTDVAGIGPMTTERPTPVSERAERLLVVVGNEMCTGFEDAAPVVLRAIVEELGVSWSMQEEVESSARFRDFHKTDGSMLHEHADALATLLEAAGVRRPG